MPGKFRNRANDIDIRAKVSQRTCEALAKLLAKKRYKTPEDLEQSEYLKKLIVDTAAQNEAILALMSDTHDFLSEVAEDARVLCDGAHLLDQLKDQSDTMLIHIEESKAIMRIQREREQAFKAKIAEYERSERR